MSAHRNAIPTTTHARSARHQAPDPRPRLPRPSPEGFSPPHYLVVEDDAVLVRALSRFLRRSGGEATTAPTIAEALRHVATGKPIDGMLLDVGLPDGSGLELLALARAHGVHAPALVLTGHHDGDTIARAQLHRAQFLPKPPREENLRAFVETTVELRRLTRVRLEEAVAEWSERHGLAAREKEVLLLASMGFGRQDLAEKMGVQKTTVKTTVRRLLRKSKHFTLGDLTATIHRALFSHE